ncbi:MAG: hypothetical protein GY807_06480, partial [Gammaproteobacteria bacterium]|nr:hypothetical protein [Gammaproteobacteria bacterium]
MPTPKTKKKKKKTAKIAPTRLQGYFTRSNLAFRIAEFINHHATDGPVQSVIDPSGGTGFLLKGIIDAHSRKHPLPKLHMVEPVPPLEFETPFNRIKKHIGLYDMTLEEWCLTYAEPQSYDLWLCNPPFNERLGTTHLGEHCHKLFKPDIKYFETLFFMVGSVVAKRYMAFIVPDSYFSKSEARPTMQRLAQSGWNLEDVRALPLDGCYNALENMSFLFFERYSPVADWVDQVIALVVRHGARPLFKNRTQVTVTGIHGPRTGYLIKEEGSTKPEAEKGLDLEIGFDPWGTFVSPPDLAAFDWVPQPRREGDLWNRMGCVYELTAYGWEAANSQGYCDGIPVDVAFDKARLAYKYLQMGAFYTANAILEKTNLDTLRAKYKEITAASFLMVLTKGKTVENPFEKDLAHLGLLEIPPEDEPYCVSSPLIERVHDYLISKEALSEAQACKLFLTYEEVPEWIFQKVMETIRNQTIPMDRFTLRSPWIPRALIAEYLEVKIDSQGFFVGANPLMAYLNYGKDGSVIKDSDRDLFEVESHKFAVCMNNWSSREETALRMKVHAHFVMANAPVSRVIEAYTPPKTAPGTNLHPWQADDINFYLSGATISNLGVGVGKTLTALAAAVAYTRNTNRKALIAVPKQVLMKWKRDLKTFFPGIGVHLLGFYVKKNGKGVGRLPQKNITSEAKKVFWDPGIQVIITSHQAIGDFQLRAEEILAADQENALDQLGTSDHKTAAKARACFVKKSAERNFNFGGELTWSDLPAGMLVIIDEAHNYKNLFPMPDSGWGQKLIMAGSAGESKRARDLQIKLDLVRRRGGKTIGLTATMVSNSVAEIFNMLRVFAPHTLDQMGIHNTQNVIQEFCTIEAIVSVSITGNIQQGTTITGFKNLDVLANLWDTCTKTYTSVDVGLSVPEVVEIKEMITPTPAIKSYMDYWKELLDQIIEKRAKRSGDHEEDTAGAETEQHEVCVFDIISAIDKVAAHPPQVDIQENPKLDRLIANVLRV